jgi:hypothetical protein
MKRRWLILLAALAAASCKLSNRNTALVVTKVVIGKLDNNLCTYDASANEFDFAHINPAANTGGTMGVVVKNQLLDPATLNAGLRTTSSMFHPHQMVGDYEIIGGAVTRGVIIPVSGAQVPPGGSSSVLVPFFSPTVTTTMTGTIRVTFHIEGKLDDGSIVTTSEHEYIFVTCATAGCNSPCL